MPIANKPKVKHCIDCACSLQHNDELRCLLNPPAPISPYDTAYPAVRPLNPACFQARPKPKGKT